MHDLPSDVCLRHIVDAALINIWVLVDYRDGVVYWVIVQLRFIVLHVQLELCGLLNRARQFVSQAVRAALERIEGRVELFNMQAEPLGDCQATVTGPLAW